MLVVDAHEDIAWNILTLGRQYEKNAAEIRASEASTPYPAFNGSTLLGLDDWLRGEVAVVFSTLFASPVRRRLGDWDTQFYRDTQEAYRRYNAQLDAYYRLVENNQRFRLISTQGDLSEVLATWEPDRAGEDRVIGLIPLMEGADGIREPREVEEWFERGVRVVGLSWESTAYAGGTHEPGPLTDSGYELLEYMASFRMILDLSHIAEEAYFQALERYEGTLIASHSNPRRFLPTSRGLSDEMIAALAERGGVVGIVPYNSFLKPGWRKGDPRQEVPIVTVVDAIDHVCQITGSADHVGIGTDFDGGFGLEHVPDGFETISDLQKLIPLLRERGYTDDQMQKIMSGNWLYMLRESLPDWTLPGLSLA